MGTTKIDRSRVADTALRLLNEVGLDGLTLRAIARELDVKAPALYWHFKDKQALLDEMATVMHRRMVEGGLPGPTPQGWQEQLVAYNLGLRRGLLRYRDGAKVYGGAKFTGTDYADGLEGHLRTMVDAGFELWQAVRAGTTAYSYTMGFVSEEQGVRPMPDQQREGFDVTERAERLARYPLAAAAGSEIFANYDERFEDGLRLIIAGIEARYGGAEDPGHTS
ncbi:TetR/AcrR family transcriptional regulator C-terminal domain-containing protein [Streptomyces sp. DT20]|uniref:TetR/AcrR family transcriptional regulator C-terminal domain-containing protein n=1 Tax=unclassified Streptomyces TaxID=2593676 RepID=UPI000939A467|nr:MULTISPECIES: TetR/AcrR family transcriptional regulator C-terminal domain-containing protein [unclassified Streptomyces]OKK24714.1 TetR family transcriptional regulator [Streptomyces sp. CB02488]WRZ13849.1 TetR/AcrR family transcriptional regulator C-terminal domain-containing protein [Streptomyces sp. NBC_00341]